MARLHDLNVAFDRQARAGQSELHMAMITKFGWGIRDHADAFRPIS